MCSTIKSGAVHPFESAGLGKAPFRYVGMEAQQLTAAGTRVIGNAGGVQIETKPGGTCAYCGTYIVNMYVVRSADGQTFHVGSDCIGKVGDAAMVAAVGEDERKRKRENKAKRDADRIAAAVALLPRVQGTLAADPHPSEGLARQGRTLVDWVRWMLDHAGTSGKLRAAAVIERAVSK